MPSIITHVHRPWFGATQQVWTHTLQEATYPDDPKDPVVLSDVTNDYRKQSRYLASILGHWTEKVKAADYFLLGHDDFIIGVIYEVPVIFVRRFKQLIPLTLLNFVRYSSVNDVVTTARFTQNLNFDHAVYEGEVVYKGEWEKNAFEIVCSNVKNYNIQIDVRSPSDKLRILSVTNIVRPDGDYRL